MIGFFVGWSLSGLVVVGAGRHEGRPYTVSDRLSRPLRNKKSHDGSAVPWPLY